MTIAIGVAVPEGLVLAADSRTTYRSSTGFRAATDHANKVFRISDHCAAACFGWAFLNGKVMSRVVEDFKATFADVPADPGHIHQSLASFFEDQYNQHVKTTGQFVPPDQIAFGFIVAEYGANGEGSLYRCYFPGKSPELVYSTEKAGVLWEGQFLAVYRLFFGFDPRVYAMLPPEIRAVADTVRYNMTLQMATLQDAIDLAIFLVRTTLGVQRFTDGVLGAPGDIEGVGGAIDVAVLTRDGFSWVQKKQLHGEFPSWLRNSTYD